MKITEYLSKQLYTTKKNETVYYMEESRTAYLIPKDKIQQFNSYREREIFGIWIGAMVYIVLGYNLWLGIIATILGWGGMLVLFHKKFLADCVLRTNVSSASLTPIHPLASPLWFVVCECLVVAMFGVVLLFHGKDDGTTLRLVSHYVCGTFLFAVSVYHFMQSIKRK